MARLRPVILILILTALAGYAASAENAKVCDHCKQVINGSYVVIKKGDKTFYLCKSCMERAKQSAPSCSLCGQKITGSYSKVERDGETIYFCGDCVKNAPRCKKCKIPIKAGQEVCARCARLLPTCTLCHKYITGSYKNFADGSRFCEDCEKLPRCDWCQHPYKPGTGIKLGGGTICPACKDKALVCGCCGKLIRGKYYSHTFIDGYFCESCEKDNTKCSVCSRPISGEPTMIGGKRPLCKICMKTVLLDKDDYRKVYDDSVKMLSKLLGEEVYHEVSLDVVDDISKVREKAGFESDGKELGLFKRKDNDFGIYILYGATRELAYETIPHEWAHAWFAENGHQLHLQWVEEGFCQWVASKILAEKKYKRGLGILENRKDLYGKGYRYISMIERQGGGIDAVLDFVKSEPPADLRREKK